MLRNFQEGVLLQPRGVVRTSAMARALGVGFRLRNDMWKLQVLFVHDFRGRHTATMPPCAPACWLHFGTLHPKPLNPKHKIAATTIPSSPNSEPEVFFLGASESGPLSKGPVSIRRSNCKRFLLSSFGFRV